MNLNELNDRDLNVEVAEKETGKSAWLRLMGFHLRWRSKAIYTERQWLRRLFRTTYDATFPVIEWITLKLQARAWARENRSVSCNRRV